MNLALKTFALSFSLTVTNLSGQCPSGMTTSTISGLYTADLYINTGNDVLIASSSTVTGNIYINNANVYNCGTILSKKIVMRQNSWNNQYLFLNNNIINCDTLLFDTLGHFHNNATLICRLFRMKNYTSADNYNTMDVNQLFVETGSMLNSQGKITTNFFELKGNYSKFYNLYGTLATEKLFRCDTNSTAYGILFICVDSCFINNGTISAQAVATWTSSIKVRGISENNGIIANIDFCDYTTTNGGMLDVNTGTVTNNTYCTASDNYCSYIFTTVKANNITTKNVSVYPNPTTGSLNIRADIKDFGNAEIEIINYLGQTVLKLPYADNISVAPLSSGYYTLKILTASGQFNSNFVKQ